MRVPLTKEQRIQVMNTEDVYKIMQQVLLRENKIERNKEHFWVVCLSGIHRIMLIELLGLGTESACVLEPTEVFSFALQKQAKRIIMVHNHSSERMLAPSPDDLDATDRMYQVGKFLKLPLLDHLIINEKKYLSFEETGALERLSKSKKYVLKYQQEAEKLLEKGRLEGIKIGEERGLEKGKIQVVKALKKKGVDVKLIAAASGLSIVQIKKL
jgi:DNA repair protein RadC